MRRTLRFKPNFKITGTMNSRLKSNKKQYVNNFLFEHAKRLIDIGYDLRYRKLSNIIRSHFRKMNLEFVDVALPKDNQNFTDHFMISQSPHSWSLRSPYNYKINCKFPTHYVEKLISLYDAFAKKVKRSRTLKIETFDKDDFDAKDTSLLLAYEIFPHGKNVFLPRISLYLETFFMNIWILAEQDPPYTYIGIPDKDYIFIADWEDASEHEYQTETTSIKITFNTKRIGYHKGKSFRGKHKKNIDRTLIKNFSAPEELSDVTNIYLDSWEFEQGREGELILYYEIPSDQIWYLDINNILGLIDLLLKGS